MNPKPLHVHFVVPATEKNTLIFLAKLKDKNKFFNELTADFIQGKFTNSQTKREKLKDEKTEQEVLNLKIKNKIALITEMKYSPDNAVQIVNNPDQFKVDETAPNNSARKNTLSTEQWDYVYGCLIDAYHRDDLEKKTCLICRDTFTKDETARKHVIDNHPDDIKKAVTKMGFST